MELFFDVETSGFLLKNLEADDPKQAWIVQLAFILSTKDTIYCETSMILNDNGREINPHAQAVHGISKDLTRFGFDELCAIEAFQNCLRYDPLLICHNYAFDSKFMEQLFLRNDNIIGLQYHPNRFCTMESTTDLLKLPFAKNRNYGNKNYKWPKLEELHQYVFDCSFEGAHDALADVRATRRCYYALKEKGLI